MLLETANLMDMYSYQLLEMDTLFMLGMNHPKDAQNKYKRRSKFRIISDTARTANIYAMYVM